MPHLLAMGFMSAASLFTASNAILFAAYTVGQAAAFALPAALSIGISAVQAAEMRKRMRQVNDNNAIQTLLKQAIPPQRLILGTATTGGALFFFKDKPPYLWMGILLAAHECDGLDSLYINGRRVFIGADGFATSVPFSDGSNHYLEVSFRNGHIDQAIDPIIARDFPDMPATFRQRGHATIVVKAHYGFGADREAKDDDHKTVYGDSGQFAPLTRLRGARIHDPRAPGQSLADPTSWTWSDNAALAMAHYLTYRWPDTRLVDPGRIDWDKVAEAADICDRWQGTAAGGTIRAATVNGVVQSTDDPFDVIENLKTALTGLLVLEGGRVFPVARAVREPEATLHLGMVRGGFQYSSEPALAEMANIIKTTFVAPDRDWQTVAGPVLRRTDYITADGAPREQTVSGAFVEDHRRMQAKAKAEMALRRRGRTVICGASLEAIGWQIGKPYRVDLPGLFAKANGVYELVGKDWDEKARALRLSLVEDVAASLRFSPSEEQAFTLDDDTIAAEAA